MDKERVSVYFEGFFFGEFDRAIEAYQTVCREHGKENVRVRENDGYGNADGLWYNFLITAHRDETDEEFEARKKKLTEYARKRAEEKEQWELAEYTRLKEKYELGISTPTTGYEDYQRVMKLVEKYEEDVYQELKAKYG